MQNVYGSVMVQAGIVKADSKYKIERLTLPAIKIYYKAMVIKTMWYWCKGRPVEQKREPRHRPLHIWPLDKTKMVLQESEGKNELFNKRFWDNWLLIWEMIDLHPLPHTIQ